MKLTSLIVVLMLLAAPLAIAQTPMSASAGLGPGNSFTLFVTFQDPMPKIDGIGCSFALAGSPKPGQEDFGKNVYCNGPPSKDDDTHYRVTVSIPPSNCAAGDYNVAEIDVVIGGVTHPYIGQNLPTLAPVPISNAAHLKFSPIKKLEVKP
jgi:hypothetical protein